MTAAHVPAGEPRLVRGPVSRAGPDRPAGGRPAALVRVALLPACDAVAIAAGALLLGAPDPRAASYALGALLALACTGRHRLRICLRLADELPGLLAATALPALPVALLVSSAAPARLGCASACLVVAARALAYAALRGLHRRGRLVEPALVVGTGTLGVEVAELLREHPELGLRPVGFLDSLPPGPLSTLPLLGELAELPAVIARHGVRRVLVCFPADSDADVVTVLRANRPLPAEVCVVPRMYELGSVVPAGRRDEVWGVPLIPLRRFGFGRGARLARRAVDLVLGGALLVAAAPLLLALAAAVSLRGARPVLFRQARVSEAGRVVRIAKLRTLTDTAPDTRWLASAEGSSGVGRWLRATHLDELPQLLNVVRGDMSLVGPRPERPHFAARFAEVVPRYADRHRVPAGMTGWAQVHGLYGDTPIAERVRFDNHYIEHWSPWLDAVILARTVAAPLAGSRRAHRARGEQP